VIGFAASDPWPTKPEPVPEEEDEEDEEDLDPLSQARGAT
jgi:hypothetical protein